VNTNTLTIATLNLEYGGIDPGGTPNHREGVIDRFGVYPETVADGVDSYRQARTGGTDHAVIELTPRLAALAAITPPGPPSDP
jgi:hypothetical protein